MPGIFNASTDVDYTRVLFIVNPFTAVISIENANKSAKFESFKHVKGFASKRIALKLDVIGPENILFAGASVHLSARKLYVLGQ